MQISKQILLIALGMSFHHAVMSMEEIKNIDLIRQEEELKQHANYVSQYIKIFHPKTENFYKTMLPFVNWLTEQRNNTSETDTWDKLVKQLEDKIEIPTCSLLHHIKKLNPELVDTVHVTACTPERYHVVCSQASIIRTILIEQAYQLQPNKDNKEVLQNIQLTMSKKILDLLINTYVH